ncbi:hypothetical protein GCM10020331_004940 [Ectobacillus funiculus]
MIPLVLELGGKDPGIVCEDADVNEAAKQIISGAFFLFRSALHSD